MLQGITTRLHRGELVFHKDFVLDRICQYVQSQRPDHQTQLQQTLSIFKSRFLPLFDAGNELIKIDAAVVLLEELGVYIDIHDWAAFKSQLLMDATNTRTNMSLDFDGFEQDHQQSLGSEVSLAHEEQPDSGVREGMDVDGCDDADDDNDDDLPDDIPTLKTVIRNKNKVIRQLQHGKKRVQQRLRRTTERIQKIEQKHQKELAKLRDDMNASFVISRTSSKPKAWITPQGCVAIALRRNIGNVACALLGHVVLQDIAGCTVSRCEIKSAAALVAHAHDFFEYLQHSMSSTSDTACSLAIYAVRQDATNSGIWKKSKLAALELESFFVTDLASLQDAMERGYQLRRLADIQRVTDGTTMGTLALYLKQMQSIGAPTWFELLLACYGDKLFCV